MNKRDRKYQEHAHKLSEHEQILMFMRLTDYARREVLKLDTTGANLTVSIEINCHANAMIKAMNKLLPRTVAELEDIPMVVARRG